MSRALKLEVVYDWREIRLSQRLLERGDSVSFGTGPRASLVAPEGQADHLGQDPWPKKMALLSPRRIGYRLRLVPAMTGRLTLGGKTVDVGSLFTLPAKKRFLRKPAAHRDVEFAPGDSAVIVVDAVNQLRITLGYVDPPEALQRPRLVEPLLFRCTFWSVNAILSALIVVIFFGSRVPPFTPDLAISEQRLAKILPPDPDPMKDQMDKERAKAEADAAEARRKRMEREAAEARKAKHAEGKQGHPDANRKDTVLPKGKEDVIRDKVQKTGLLAIIGSQRAPSSGLSKLLSQENNDVEQAVTGLQGAKLAVGRGAHGMGYAGQGLGGGGTTYGHFGASGNLDVGTGRGRGRRGPNLGTGKERQVSVGLETGSPDAEGGLSKEQVMRVVRSHAAAIKYCYDKELQRAPHLSGRIDIAWVIHSNGSVDRARVAKSAMGNAAVEGCIVRTLKSWQFPKADADTIVQSFPFLFKGGS
jgi:outer membrane biosynthesis protein TonB